MADENSAAADSPPGPSEDNANNGDVPPRGGRRLAVPLPAKLEMRGDMSSNWRSFERMWRNCEIVTRLREETAEFRTATLLTCIGSEGLDVYEGLPFAKTRTKDRMSRCSCKSFKSSAWERLTKPTNPTCSSVETRTLAKPLNRTLQLCEKW